MRDNKLLVTREKDHLKYVCTLLDFTKGTGLISNTEDTSDNYTQNIFLDCQNKLGIDAIFFFRPEHGGPSVPLIYFKLMEGKSPNEIIELHKLSWNMGQAPLLFVILPDSIQIYNNLVPPKYENDTTGLIDELKLFSRVQRQREALKRYNRLEFESGNFWRTKGKKLNMEKTIFKHLLENLDYTRRELIRKGLPSNIVYSLLIRSIFTKYLEDRKDSKNSSVFPIGYFGEFLKDANSFTDLLTSKDATFAFFHKLSAKFDGDIFLSVPNEEDVVTQEHLLLIQLMLKGGQHLATKQTTLWQLYSFDVIPIELISSIYEQFFMLKKEEEIVLPKGIHYTPYPLVAFLTSEVLPLDSIKKEMKILDPACGSGIFLVEAFRRLVYSWMASNGYARPKFSDLTKILNENIIGVDIDGKAIKIAALSLYLTLCEYLEPKTIWDEVKFERLEGERLFVADFFDTTAKFANLRYDIIIGNPPWKSELTPLALRYVSSYSHSKPIGDKQICQAFLWKSADLSNADGKICLLVSSKALLFNRSGNNFKFREKFLSTYCIKAIFNFSALRHSLFSNAVGPGAAIIFSPSPPKEDQIIFYCSPKPSFTIQDRLAFVIEPQDIAKIPLTEALEFDIIWKVAMWGSARDFELSDQRAGNFCVKRNLWRYNKDSVFIIKPNQARYWSRSAALLDADKIYADIMIAWRDTS